MDGPVIGKFIPAGHGHRLYIEEHGNPDGEALLLVHGGSGFTFDVEKLAALHGADKRIIVMHQRGIGNSTPQGGARHNSVQDNIDDIERVRDALGLADMEIFSWSFGTVFAAGYALEHPGRVKSLMAYAPYLGSAEDYEVPAQKSPDMAEQYFALHGARHGRGIVKSVFNKAAAKDVKTRFNAYWTALQLTVDSPPDKDALYKSKTPDEWDAFFNIRLIAAQHDLELFTGKDRFLEKRAQKLAGRDGGKTPFPVTLVYGTNDNWAAPNDYARKVFPGAAVAFVPGAGHDVHDSRVQAALARLLRLPVKARKASCPGGSVPRR